MIMQPENRSRVGFRYSLIDGIVLVLGAWLTWYLRQSDFALWWIVPTVLGHFFLFCNVFLVWRRWELVWAALFLVNVAVHLTLGYFGWRQPLLLQLPVTLVVIVRQLRSCHYRGIFAKKINPHLFESLSA